MRNHESPVNEQVVSTQVFLPKVDPRHAMPTVTFGQKYWPLISLAYHLQQTKSDRKSHVDLAMVAQTLDYTCGAACFDSMFRYFKNVSPGEMHFAQELGALDFLAKTPLPDLITLDLMMPVMDGWTFAGIVDRDQRLRGIPIVVITAFPQQAERLQKAYHVLRKPLDFQVLRAIVQQICPFN